MHSRHFYGNEIVCCSYFNYLNNYFNNSKTELLIIEILFKLILINI